MSSQIQGKTFSQIFGILAIAIIGMVSAIVIISAYLLYTENYSWDPPNWITLIVELGIGIAVTASILIYSNQQQKKITELINEVKKIEEQQQVMLSSEKERIEKWKNEWGTVILVNLEFIENMHNILRDWLKEYQIKPSEQQKINIIESAKRNGDLVQMQVNQIQNYIPKIENHFVDPVLGLNIQAISEIMPNIFYSLDAEHMWEHDLEGTFSLIEDKKRVLSGIIERLKKEIPNTT